MTVLEQRFMERMPIILTDLTKAISSLTKEVAELKKELEEIKNK